MYNQEKLYDDEWSSSDIKQFGEVSIAFSIIFESME